MTIILKFPTDNITYLIFNETVAEDNRFAKVNSICAQ